MKGARGKKAIGLTLVALALGGAGFAVYKLMTAKTPALPRTTMDALSDAVPYLRQLKLLNAMDKDRPAAANKIVDQLIKGKKPQPGDGKVSDFFTSITKGQS